MTRKPLCKLDRVLLFLRQNQAGLNALEAVQLGEYALRSTISTLREEGWQIEGVPHHHLRTVRTQRRDDSGQR